MFPEVVFGVSHVILAKQRDDMLERFIRTMALELLLVESDSPMIGERRSSNHPWVVENMLKRVAKLRSIPVPMMERLVETGDYFVLASRNVGTDGGRVLQNSILSVLFCF